MSEQWCPLCPENHATESLRKHLGGHLQQVALFVSSRDGDGVTCEETSVGVAAVGKLESRPNPASHSGADENTLAENEDGQSRFGPRVGSVLLRLESTKAHPIFSQFLVHSQCSRVQENQDTGMDIRNSVLRPPQAY